MHTASPTSTTSMAPYFYGPLPLLLLSLLPPPYLRYFSGFFLPNYLCYF